MRFFLEASLKGTVLMCPSHCSPRSRSRSVNRAHLRSSRLFRLNDILPLTYKSDDNSAHNQTLGLLSFAGSHAYLTLVAFVSPIQF
jgi:hypothetical protein